jgi:hypothetical protein
MSNKNAASSEATPKAQSRRMLPETPQCQRYHLQMQELGHIYRNPAMNIFERTAASFLLRAVENTHTYECLPDKYDHY